MSKLLIYVKPTSNYPAGETLRVFDQLGPTWSGESLKLPFGPVDGPRPVFEVVGWSDRFGGAKCKVHVAKVRRTDAEGRSSVGYLVWGGNAGVRILDDEAEPTLGVDDHLPRGYGRPFVWVEGPDDLPAEVLAVVEGSECGELAELVGDC